VAAVRDTITDSAIKTSPDNTNQADTAPAASFPENIDNPAPAISSSQGATLPKRKQRRQKAFIWRSAFFPMDTKILHSPSASKQKRCNQPKCAGAEQMGHQIIDSLRCEKKGRPSTAKRFDNA